MTKTRWHARIFMVPKEMSFIPKNLRKSAQYRYLMYSLLSITNIVQITLWNYIFRRCTRKTGLIFFTIGR